MTEERVTEKSVSTRKGLAAVFDVNLATIDKWKYQWKTNWPDCPCDSRHYDLKWIAKWNLGRSRTPQKVRKISADILGEPYVVYGDSGSEANGNGDSTDGLGAVDLKMRLMAAQIRKENANADSSEIKNRSLQADLVEKEKCVQVVSLLLSQTRAVFSRIPGEMEAGLPKRYRDAIRTELSQRIEMALVSIHSFLTDAENVGD